MFLLLCLFIQKLQLGPVSGLLSEVETKFVFGLCLSVYDFGTLMFST